MKNSRLFFATFLLVLSITSCTKDDDPVTPDYGATFKNTVWTGNFNYANQPIQPMSIAFNENGTFIWYELDGEFPGTWSLVNDIIEVNFQVDRRFKAKINKDNKLINIESTPPAFWTIQNAELNTISDDLLDNSAWETQNLLVEFLMGTKVQMKLGGSLQYPEVSYDRRAKYVRWNYPNYRFFLVRKSNSVFDGINRPTEDVVIYPFQITKK